MTNGTTNQYPEKLAVVQTKSKKYGQCAFDIQYAVNIDKVKLSLVNKLSTDKGTLTEHYLNVDDFLVLANDILTAQFKNYSILYKDGNVEKTKIGYVEYKGSTKQKDGQSVTEARILEIDFLSTQKVPYLIKISTGKGHVIGHGAISMVGRPEKQNGIFLTEFQMKKMFKMAQVGIEAQWQLKSVLSHLNTNQYLSQLVERHEVTGEIDMDDLLGEP